MNRISPVGRFGLLPAAASDDTSELAVRFMTLSVRWSAPPAEAL
jgi:hypothetical protein